MVLIRAGEEGGSSPKENQAAFSINNGECDAEGAKMEVHYTFTRSLHIYLRLFCMPRTVLGPGNSKIKMQVLGSKTFQLFKGKLNQASWQLNGRVCNTK